MDFLQAFDDDLFPGLQSVGDHPFVPDGLADFNHPGCHLAVRAHHHHGGDAVRADADAALGNGDGLGVHRLFQHAPRKHPRQEQMIGIGKFRPQRNHAAGRVHRDIGEQQFAGVRVGRPVVQQQRHLGFAGRGGFERAIFQFAPQPQQFGARFGEIAINRVQLRDHGHFRRRALADQRAFGDQRRADAVRKSAR